MEILIICGILIIVLLLVLIFILLAGMKLIMDYPACELIKINTNLSKIFITVVAIKGYIAISNGWETKEDLQKDLEEIDHL